MTGYVPSDVHESLAVYKGGGLLDLLSGVLKQVIRLVQHIGCGLSIRRCR